MSDLDPRQVFESAEVEGPTPEFVARLRAEIDRQVSDAAATSRANGTGAGPVEVMPDRSGRTGRSRLRWLARASAAAAIIIVAIVVFAVGNGDQSTDVVDQPDRKPFEENTPSVDDMEPDDRRAEVDWTFDVTEIMVGTGNAVAVGPERAWTATDAPALSTIDLATNTVISTTEIPFEQSFGAATFGFGSAWFGTASGEVVRYDPVTATVAATIDIGADPAWMEPGYDSIWLGTPATNEVVRIDPATNTVRARVDVGVPVGAAFENPDGIWSRGSDGTVHHIDPSNNELVATIETPSGALSITTSATAAWAPGGVGSSTVFRIDSQTGSIVAEVDLQSVVGAEVNPEGLTYLHGSVWQLYSYDCNPDCRRGIARIDIETNAVVAHLDLGSAWSSGGGVAVGPDSVWVSTADRVARIDP